MGQTILCEVIAVWEETGKQPDFTEFGFASVLDALKEAQETMLELGSLCNHLKEWKILLERTTQQSAQRTRTKCGSYDEILDKFQSICDDKKSTDGWKAFAEMWDFVSEKAAQQSAQADGACNCTLRPSDATIHAASCPANR